MDLRIQYQECNDFSADDSVKVWNSETGDQQRTIATFRRHVTAVQFIGESDNIVTSCGDKQMRIHNAANGGQVTLPTNSRKDLTDRKKGAEKELLAVSFFLSASFCQPYLDNHEIRSSPESLWISGSNIRTATTSALTIRSKSGIRRRAISSDGLERRSGAQKTR
jgi:hypothetical protein